MSTITPCLTVAQLSLFKAGGKITFSTIFYILNSFFVLLCPDCSIVLQYTDTYHLLLIGLNKYNVDFDRLNFIKLSKSLK
jgi:hypothetical protein